MLLAYLSSAKIDFFIWFILYPIFKTDNRTVLKYSDANVERFRNNKFDEYQVFEPSLDNVNDYA